MYCSKCGNEIKDTDTICPNCGTPTQIFFDQYGDNEKIEKTATDSLLGARILGILSIVLSFIIPLAGWILGGIGCSHANRWKYTEFAKDARKAKLLNIVGLLTATLVFLFYFSLALSNIGKFLGI